MRLSKITISDNPDWDSIENELRGYPLPNSGLLQLTSLNLTQNDWNDILNQLRARNEENRKALNDFLNKHKFGK